MSICNDVIGGSKFIDIKAIDLGGDKSIYCNFVLATRSLLIFLIVFIVTIAFLLIMAVIVVL